MADAGATIGRKVADDKFLLHTSLTIPEALCALVQQDGRDAVCLRRHPHDVAVELQIDRADLQWAVSSFRDRLANDISLEIMSTGQAIAHCNSYWAANLLRRSLQSTVDVLACTGVRIIANTSGIEDWVLAHRFGQVAMQGDSVEARGRIDVQGRTALAADIEFEGEPDARVAAQDDTAQLVQLASQQRFSAELFFSRGTGAQHAKFQCCAAPSYVPEVRLQREATPEELAALTQHGYVLSGTLLQRQDGPCRIEAARELVPELPLEFGAVTMVGVEAIGQISAEDCVHRSLRAALAEAEDILQFCTT